MSDPYFCFNAGRTRGPHESTICYTFPEHSIGRDLKHGTHEAVQERMINRAAFPARADDRVSVRFENAVAIATAHPLRICFPSARVRGVFQFRGPAEWF